MSINYCIEISIINYRRVGYLWFDELRNYDVEVISVYGKCWIFVLRVVVSFIVVPVLLSVMLNVISNVLL